MLFLLSFSMAGAMVWGSVGFGVTRNLQTCVRLKVPAREKPRNPE